MRLTCVRFGHLRQSLTENLLSAMRIDAKETTATEQFGRELRRPRADMLRDGIYELRTEVRSVNYRLLHGFVGKDVALLSHV